MTHEQLIAVCFLWHWNSFPEERRMLYGVNNNTSAGLSKQQQIREGAKNKAKGVVAGVFDLVYLPPVNVSVPCAYLDGKVGADKLSVEQEDFKQKLHLRGIPCYVFSSLRQFQDIINTLRNGQ
jgi:hypothetical protein